MKAKKMKAFAAERASAVLPSSGVVSGFLESKKNQSERPADFSSLQTATLPHGRKWMPATSTTVSFRLSRILVHPHSRTSAAAYYQLYRKLPASKMVSKCYHCANNKVASGGGLTGNKNTWGTQAAKAEAMKNMSKLKTCKICYLEIRKVTVEDLNAGKDVTVPGVDYGEWWACDCDIRPNGGHKYEPTCLPVATEGPRTGQYPHPYSSADNKRMYPKTIIMCRSDQGGCGKWRPDLANLPSSERSKIIREERDAAKKNTTFVADLHAKVRAAVNDEKTMGKVVLQLRIPTSQKSIFVEDLLNQEVLPNPLDADLAKATRKQVNEDVVLLIVSNETKAFINEVKMKVRKPDGTDLSTDLDRGKEFFKVMKELYDDARSSLQKDDDSAFKISLALALACDQFAFDAMAAKVSSADCLNYCSLTHVLTNISFHCPFQTCCLQYIVPNPPESFREWSRQPLQLCL